MASKPLSSIVTGDVDLESISEKQGEQDPIVTVDVGLGNITEK